MFVCLETSLLRIQFAWLLISLGRAGVAAAPLHVQLCIYTAVQCSHCYSVRCQGPENHVTYKPGLLTCDAIM